MSQALPRLARLAALQALRSSGLAASHTAPSSISPKLLQFAKGDSQPAWGGMTFMRRMCQSTDEAAKAAAAEAYKVAEAKMIRQRNTVWYINTLLYGSFACAMAFSYVIFSSKLPQNPALMAQADYAAATKKPKEVVKDYPAVRSAIAEVMDAPEYDDGSYGPIFVRLAWHTSGTYDKASGTGGSNGATMRFAPECNHAANAGLDEARRRLEPVKEFFPWISYADLWTLAGAVAVEEMGGPHVPWRPGRVDHINGDNGPVDGRLPDASKGAAHVREVFGRMGFDEKETVALVGAHSLGRCHTTRSGYDGPWTNAPTTFSNLYFQELLNNKWTKKKWKGPEQYEDKSKQLMMTPSDMSLIWDKKLRKYVEEYAKDGDAFFRDFAAAFSKMLELGVTFPEGTPAAA